MANIAESETFNSDSITALRFPLIVAIVFIHTFIIGQPTIDGKINVNYGQFPLYDFLDYVIRICFAEIAVPPSPQNIVDQTMKDSATSFCPDAVIRTGTLTIEVSNHASREVLSLIRSVMKYAT